MYSNYYDELASSRQQGFEMLFNEVYARVYDRVLRENSGAGSMNGKAFLACVLMSVVLTGCETAKKNQPVIRNPDIQVGKLMEQSTELTVTLLTEPDSNLTPDGEAAPVDVQLVYLSDDSKFQPPITIRLPPPRCPTCWGRTISITVTSTCCRTP